MEDNQSLVLREQSSGLVLRAVVKPAQAIEAINEFKQIVKTALVDGIDYGKLPGIAKPTLLKPGAEKLCQYYGLVAPEYPLLNVLRDWQNGIFAYEVGCKLVTLDTDKLVGYGVGECNTLEEKYRWRYSKRTCPKCGQETIFKSKNPSGGWYCYAKVGGCGANFQDGDKSIEGQEIGKVPNTEPYSIINTVLKMAKKRALVDAVLSATGSSGIFTQDVEDWIEGEVRPVGDGDQPAAGTSKQAPAPQSPRQDTPAATTTHPAAATARPQGSGQPPSDAWQMPTNPKSGKPWTREQLFAAINYITERGFTVATDKRPQAMTMEELYDYFTALKADFEKAQGAA